MAGGGGGGGGGRVCVCVYVCVCVGGGGGGGGGAYKIRKVTGLQIRNNIRDKAPVSFVCVFCCCFFCFVGRFK